MPFAAHTYEGLPVTFSPRTVTDPESGVSIPETQFRSVVLPDPFGPIRPTTLAVGTSSETSDSACTLAKLSERPVHTTPDAPAGPSSGTASSWLCCPGGR